MKFIFSWKNYFTSKRSNFVKFFFHEKINFISSSQRVIFFFYYIHMSISKKKMDEKQGKQRNDVSDILTSEHMENISLVSRM